MSIRGTQKDLKPTDVGCILCNSGSNDRREGTRGYSPDEALPAEQVALPLHGWIRYGEINTPLLDF